MEKNELASLPPEEWREKVEEQATPKMFERLHRAARARLRTFAGPKGKVNAADVDDVVSSVVTDTLDGRLTWDPEKEPLEQHLLDAVRFRVRDQWERHQPHLHDQLEEGDGADAVVERAAAGAVVPAALESPVTSQRDGRIKAVHDEVIAWLKPRVADKPEVLRLLELYMQGITDRDEVIREGGMNETTYHNARRRLGRLVQDMPAKLRAAALAALTN